MKRDVNMNGKRIARYIGAIIMHTICATVLIMKSITAIIDSISSGSLSVLLMAIIIAIIVCIGSIIVNACNIVSFVNGLCLGINKY